jgi:hypothetical protein
MDSEVVDIRAWIREMKWSWKPYLRRAETMMLHSIRSNGLARSNLSIKAFWFQDLRLKEWTISWARIILEAMWQFLCSFRLAAPWMQPPWTKILGGFSSEFRGFYHCTGPGDILLLASRSSSTHGCTSCCRPLQYWEQNSSPYNPEENRILYLAILK